MMLSEKPPQQEPVRPSPPTVKTTRATRAKTGQMVATSAVHHAGGLVDNLRYSDTRPANQAIAGPG